MKIYTSLSEDDLELLVNCLIYVLHESKNMKNPDRLEILKDKLLNEQMYKQNKRLYNNE
jgi:hypothetical protein